MAKSSGKILDEILHDIESSPSGPHIGAIFDYDGTLIAGYSATAFMREQLMSGLISPRELRDQFQAIQKFMRGRIGFSAFMEANSGALRGRSEKWFTEFGERVFNKSIAGSIYPESRKIVDAHLAKGHTVAIISSATKYQINPVAYELGITNVLCTQMEVEDGIFTGDVLHPTCFGHGKLLAAQDLSRKRDVDLQETYFYTDSDDDLELLESVGRPRILNPNSRLDSIARARSWPTYRFKSRGRPTLQTMLRTGLAYGAMPTAFAATAPIYALTGEKREMLNSAIGMWADYACAVTGIKLKIEGEENLWSHRPAVFAFNHQSSVDALIVAKLIRRDFTAVGKKEIERFPVIGQLMKFGDVAFIDRGDKKKAMEAMRPVIDALTTQNLSVAIAPEGTRSVSTSLGAFKKGPFHIAMQAGVPMVPIVIHNASDALPKGRNIARAATIRISVLDPVDTTDWSPDMIEDHIDDVRGRFLDALDQAEYDADEELINLDHWDVPETT